MCKGVVTEAVTSRFICVCVCWKMTNQFLLLHTLHENDEQMLSLCAAVGESLLDGHQQLVS